jgi:hypothetical protein
MIAAQVRRARLEDVLGSAGAENVQGETQQKLDVIANEILMRNLGGRQGVAIVASEENEKAVILRDQNDGETLSKRLLVFNVETREGVDLGSFPMRSGKLFGGELRCDLHPRWDRTGTAICFDALESNGWTRQLHVALLAPA